MKQTNWQIDKLTTGKQLNRRRRSNVKIDKVCNVTQQITRRNYNYF